MSQPADVLQIVSSGAQADDVSELLTSQTMPVLCLNSPAQAGALWASASFLPAGAIPTMGMPIAKPLRYSLPAFVVHLSLMTACQGMLHEFHPCFTQL